MKILYGIMILLVIGFIGVTLEEVEANECVSIWGIDQNTSPGEVRKITSEKGFQQWTVHGSSSLGLFFVHNEDIQDYFALERSDWDMISIYKDLYYSIDYFDNKSSQFAEHNIPYFEHVFNITDLDYKKVYKAIIEYIEIAQPTWQDPKATVSIEDFSYCNITNKLLGIQFTIPPSALESFLTKKKMTSDSADVKITGHDYDPNDIDKKIKTHLRCWSREECWICIEEGKYEVSINYGFHNNLKKAIGSWNEANAKKKEAKTREIQEAF